MLTREQWFPIFESWWINTRNPLHVWQAISLALNVEPRLAIPGWCMPYLAECSGNLDLLAKGRDFDDRAAVAPDQAHQMIGAALGLSRQGKKNAFAALQDQAADQRIEARSVTSYPEFRDVLEAAAVHDMATERNISPARAKRRLQQVRRGRRLANDNERKVNGETSPEVST